MLGILVVVIIFAVIIYIGNLQSRVHNLEREARGEPDYLDLLQGTPEAVEWHARKTLRETLERQARSGDRQAQLMLELHKRNEVREDITADPNYLVETTELTPKEKTDVPNASAGVSPEKPPASVPPTPTSSREPIRLPPSRGGEWRDPPDPPRRRERGYYIPDYDELLEQAKQHPHYTNFDSLRVAYTRSPVYTPYELHREAWLTYQMALAEGNVRGAASALGSILETDFLNIQAHQAVLDIHCALAQSIGYSIDASLHEDFLRYLVEEIEETGDVSSLETAYEVISLSEEYGMLEYLKVEKRERRTTTKDGRTYDIVEVFDPRNDSVKMIYFDITAFYGRTHDVKEFDVEPGYTLLMQSAKALGRGEYKKATSLLNRFIEYVKERTGKEFDSESASKFVTMAEQLLQAIEVKTRKNTD